ncbi:MAG: YigZ family protein [Myxococcales bacterium]|nr:YigZ family protein [Myxococcales bacterium]
MSDGTYRTLTGPSRYELDPVKASRFVATLDHVTTEDEALAVVAACEAEWPDASHHCWAYKLAGGRTRSSDAGEPGGSAGRPILARIEGKQLADAVVVVSRWFGGTKLGVGGLIRAYGACAGKALDAADVRVVPRTRALRVEHGYEDTAAVQTVLAAAGLTPLDADYGATVRLTLAAPEATADALAQRLVDATAGRAVVEAAEPGAEK